MQDRYFGDVGDFGKYGLLRILCGLDETPKLKLGVVWYLVPDEGHNADGKHIAYLQKNERKFRECDLEQFDRLRTLLFDESGQLIAGARHIKNAETPGVLPEGTLFYRESLVFSPGPPYKARAQFRNDWYTRAQAAMAGIDLVFLDPDNGVECATSLTAKDGPKYTSWNEIKGFVDRDKSVVVYHHLGRDGTHIHQVERLTEEFRARFSSHEVTGLTFIRGNARAFFVLASSRHAKLLRNRIQNMVASPWKHHFRFPEVMAQMAKNVIQAEDDAIQICNELTDSAFQISDQMEEGDDKPSQFL